MTYLHLLTILALFCSAEGRVGARKLLGRDLNRVDQRPPFTCAEEDVCTAWDDGCNKCEYDGRTDFSVCGKRSCQCLWDNTCSTPVCLTNDQCIYTPLTIAPTPTTTGGETNEPTMTMGPTPTTTGGETNEPTMTMGPTPTTTGGETNEPTITVAPTPTTSGVDTNEPTMTLGPTPTNTGSETNEPTVTVGPTPATTGGDTSEPTMTMAPTPTTTGGETNEPTVTVGPTPTTTGGETNEPTMTVAPTPTNTGGETDEPTMTVGPTPTTTGGETNEPTGTGPQTSVPTFSSSTTTMPTGIGTTGSTTSPTTSSTTGLTGAPSSSATASPTTSSTTGPTGAQTAAPSTSATSTTTSPTGGQTGSPTAPPSGTLSPTSSITVSPTTIPNRTCNDNPVDYDVNIDFQIQFSNNQLVSCSDNEDLLITSNIQGALNDNFPTTVSDWVGDAFFGSFVFDTNQAVDNLSGRRLRLDARSLQTGTCSTRDVDCPAGEYCRWGCTTAETTSCATNSLANWALLADDVRERLVGLGYECLGDTNLLEVILVVLDTEGTVLASGTADRTDKRRPIIFPDTGGETATDVVTKPLYVNSTFAITFFKGTGAAPEDTEVDTLVQDTTRFFSRQFSAVEKFAGVFQEFKVSQLSRKYNANAPDDLTVMFLATIWVAEDADVNSRDAANVMGESPYRKFISETVRSHGGEFEYTFRIHFRGTTRGNTRRRLEQITLFDSLVFEACDNVASNHCPE